MQIILHHTLRSIRAHKAQTLVIVLTVTVVTMLFFVSLSIGGLFYNLQLGNLSRIAGDTDVYINGDVISGEMLNEFIEQNKKDVEYVDRYLIMTGLINEKFGKESESTVIRFEATDMNVFLSRYKSKLKYYKGISPNTEYVYPGIMISKALSEKGGYEIGSELEIYLSFVNRYEKFTVTYIFENQGFFANSTVYNVLADLNVIGEKGLYTDIYIKLSKNADKQLFMDKAEAYFGDEIDVDVAVNYEYIEQVVGDNEKLLSVGILFIVAIVIFILFGAYLVLAKNRVAEMTVFKAAGATPVQMFLLLLSEGAVYGLLGGIIGTVFARLAMQIAVMLAIPMFADSITYAAWHYILSLVLGVLISLISELIPALRLTKNSLSKINTNNKKTKKVNPLFMSIPVAVILATVLCIIFLQKYVEAFTVVLIIAVVALTMIGVPYLFGFVSRLFVGCRGSSKLSSFSLKRNSEAVSVSGMLGAVITFTFIAVGIVNVVIEATNPYNERFSGDYVVQTLDKSVIMQDIKQELDDLPGVEGTNLLYYEMFDGVLAGKQKQYYVYAAPSADDLVCVVDLSDQEKEAFNNTDNAAVCGYDLINRMGWKVGDTVSVVLGKKEYGFKIVAVDYKKTSNDRVFYVNRKGTDYVFENTLIILTASKNISHDDLYALLKDKMEKEGCFILKFNDWAYATSVGIKGVSQILRFLQVIIGLVCSIGIINLTISMMIGRKREFGIYRSVGLDEKRFSLLLLAESFVISITGGIIGFVFSLIINLLMPSFASLIDRHITVGFPVSIFIIIAGVMILYAIIYYFVGTRYKINKLKIERNIR